MSYDKKPVRVLSGGLSLIAPGDVIDDAESQRLLNWAHDSFGNLRSRAGHVVAGTVGGEVNNQQVALGTRWQSAAGAVYNEFASVIAGVSADYCGLVGFRGFLWAFSQARQRKSTGSDDLRVVPEAPEDTPTALPAATTETPVVDLTGGFEVDPGDEEYDPTLTIRPKQDTAYTAEKEIDIDLGSGHSLDDVHRIRVWAKNWDRIRGLTFEVDVNDGGFQTDYYRAEMPPEALKAARKSDVTFYVRKRPLPVDRFTLDKKKYTSFQRIGSTPEKDWRSCVRVRLKVDFFENSTPVRWEEWVVVGDADNTLEGDDFRFCYTFTTAEGHESNPSPFSEPITLNRASAVVSGLEDSDDPQVTGKNLYITGGTLQGVYRVNAEIIGIGTTTYNVEETDDDITDLGIFLETDHDDPPAGRLIVGPHFNRLVAANSADHPNRYWWSKTDQPYAWPGADDPVSGNWADIGEGGEEIVQMIQYPGQIRFYTKRGLWLQSGDPDDTGAFPTSVDVGISNPQAVAKGAGVDYAAADKGLYAIDGSRAQKLSLKIDPIFKGRTVDLGGGFTALPISDFSDMAVGYRDEVVWLSYTSSGGRVTIKLDLATGRWFQDSRGFSSFLNEGGAAGFLLGGQTGGDVCALDSGTTDDGSAISLDWVSKYYDLGTLDHDDLIEDFTVWHRLPAALTVSALLNDGESSVALGTIGPSASKTRSVLLFDPDGEGVFGRNIAIRITGSVSAEASIEEMVLNFIPQARQGKSYNTDKFDCGTHKPKIFRELKSEIQNDALAEITLKTDYPGFTMSDKDTAGSFIIGSERRMEAYVFPAEYIGSLGQVIVHGDDLQVYKLWMLYQTIGTLLQGARGEYWLSDVLDFGSERVKLGKEIEAVYSTTGSGTLTVETELPDNSLTLRDTFTLTGATDEETRKFRLANTVKGRLWRFRVEPDENSDIRLESLRIFLKMVGQPNATPWAWVSLPVVPTQDAIWAELPMPPDAFG